MAITALLIIILAAVVDRASAADPAEGGTDGNIRVDGMAGSNGYDWNELHGFVILEEEEKVSEEFNVTISEDVRWNSEEQKYMASGHIFVELQGIHWDDEPTATISREDFDEYREDLVNLTVYILGEYLREGPGEDEIRQAYKEVLVQRPNNAPKPVAMITNSDENENGQWDNWTTIDTNDDDEIVYYIDSEGIAVKFYLNASQSCDQDGDNVTVWRWDLDGDGEFGAENRERKMNTTVYLGEGDHLLGLIVGDEHTFSDPLCIRIVVRQSTRYPDLKIQNIHIVNKNGMEDIEKGDRCAIIAEMKNIGDLEIEQDFDVYFEYWFRDSSPEQSDWIELGTERITDTINVNGLKLVETPWDTGISEFTPGNYSFRAYVDYNEEIKELRERNNVFPREGEDKNAENITLNAVCCGEEPDISIVDVILSKTEARVNEIVWINLTLKNDGVSVARYVDIHYFVDNEFCFFKTVDTLANDGVNWTESFVFSGDSNKTFRIKFEVKDNGLTVDASDSYLIKVWGTIYPIDYPILTITNPQNNHEVKGNVTISGTASDNNNVVKVEYRFTGTDEWLRVEGTTAWSIELDTAEFENGEYVLEFRAFNGQHYSEIQTLTIKVNNREGGSDSSGDGINTVTYMGIIGIIAFVALFGFVALKKKMRKANSASQPAIPGQLSPLTQPVQNPQMQLQYQQQPQSPMYQQTQPMQYAPPQQNGQPPSQSPWYPPAQPSQNVPPQQTGQPPSQSLQQPLQQPPQDPTAQPSQFAQPQQKGQQPQPSQNSLDLPSQQSQQQKIGKQLQSPQDPPDLH